MRAPTIVLITAAGFATAPGFLDPFRERLHEGFVQLGHAVKSCSLLPYGDWHRGKPQQLWEIYHDLRLYPETYKHSIGGNRMLHALDDDSEAMAGETCAYVMVGHSGGGVAALHAASFLMHAQKRVLGIIQIGTPKCRIAEDLQAQTLYVRGLFRNSVKQAKRWTVDPITRLGSWGSNRGVQKGLYPPGTIVDIPLIGRHPDYFRTAVPFMQTEKGANESIMYRTVWTWISGRMALEDEKGKT